MSIKAQSIFAPTPTTIRSRPTPLSADSKGERLAYAANKSIFLRNIDNPALSVQYTQHTQNTTVAKFAPSGYYVASGDVSGKVRVWDCAGTDQILKGEYPIISGRINDLSWDSESKRIIAVGEGKEKYGHCITYDSGNSVGEIAGHSKPINSVSIRPVRPYRAATASDDRSIIFLHGPPFKFNCQLRDHHSNFVQGVAFSPSGDHLVSVGSDRNIFLYDGKTGEYKSQIGSGDDAHKGSVFAVSWSADSKHFVTASADQTVKIWDVETNKATRTWKLGSSVPDQQVGVVWPTRADGTIISLSLSGDLNYLSEKDEKPYRIVTGHQKSITSLGVANEGKTIFTGSYDGRIRSWDIAKGEASPTEDTHTNQVSGMATVGGKVLSVAWDDTLRTTDAVNKASVGPAVATGGQPKGISAVGKDGLVVIATQTEILVHKDGREITNTKVNYSPTCIAGSSNSNRIAVGADNNTVHVYTLNPDNTLTETSVLTENHATISSLALTSNGKLLAVGDSTGKIVLYSEEAANKFSVKTSHWTFHTGRVYGIAWNKEETHVVTGGLDTNIYVYSVANPGKNLKVLGAHKDGVNAVGWLDAGRVVSAGGDAAVKTWEVTF